MDLEAKFRPLSMPFMWQLGDGGPLSSEAVDESGTQYESGGHVLRYRQRLGRVRWILQDFPGRRPSIRTRSLAHLSADP